MLHCISTGRDSIFFSVQTCIMVSELKSCQACVCAIILKKEVILRLGTSELEDAHSYPLGVSWPCKLELEALMELDLEEYVPPFRTSQLQDMQQEPAS